MATRYQKFGTFRDHSSSVRLLFQNGDHNPTPRVIVVHGTNETLIGETVRQIREGAIARGTVVSSLDAPGLDESSLLAITRQDCLFEPTSFYLIRRCEVAKNLARMLNATTGFTNSPNQICFVYAGDQIPQPLKAAFTKTGATLIPCYTPWPNELPQVVSYLAEGAGLKLRPEAVQTLVAYVGDDLGKNLNELRRLRLTVGNQSEPLGSQDLIPLLGLIRTDEATKLERLLLSRQWAKAQSLTSQLLERGENTLQLVALLAKHSRNALRIISAQSSGASPAALANSVNLPLFVVKTYLPHLAGVRDTGAFKAALSRCQEADTKLKSQKCSEELLLAQIIDALASA